LDASRQSLSDASHASVISNAESDKKFELIQADLDAKKSEVSTTKKAIAETKYDLEFTKGTKAIAARNAIVLKLAESEKTLAKQMREQLDLENALRQANSQRLSDNPLIFKQAKPAGDIGPGVGNLSPNEKFNNWQSGINQSKADYLYSIANKLGAAGMTGPEAQYRKMADAMIGFTTTLEEGTMKVIITGVNE
jgi:hypothetical protein